MSKNNTLAALSENHRAPEHHRVKPLLHYEFITHPGHCYCTDCEAIGFQKRWYVDSRQAENLRRDARAAALLCPGCTAISEQLYEGEVILANSKFATLGGEIIALIKHTEGRCWHHNPAAKISAFADDRGVLHIQATTRLLAERIAKELRKAFKGNLEFKRAPEEKFVRIYWTD